MSGEEHEVDILIVRNKEGRFMLLVQDIVRHASARKLEWLMAGMMIHLGYLLWHPENTFAKNPIYSTLAEYATENSWALIFGLYGLFRLGILILNGTHIKQSAELRIALSMGSFVILFIWIWGLNASGSASLGGISYKWMAFGELMNVWQASSDKLDRKAVKHGHSR